jgi:hypothetical protein
MRSDRDARGQSREQRFRRPYRIDQPIANDQRAVRKVLEGCGRRFRARVREEVQHFSPVDLQA